MKKQTLILVAAVALAFPPIAAAAPTVRTMYNDALAREDAARKALAADTEPAATLGDVRTVIARYEAVVRRYPASSYSDNALWQAANLALDAFAKFGEDEDRDRGVRLLRRLAAMFPTSKLAAQVPDRLTRVGVITADSVTSTASPAGTTAVDTPPLAPARPAADRSTPTAAVAVIKNIRRAVLNDAVRIVIELDSEVTFRQDRIPNPSRVFVDLPGTKAAPVLVDQTLRFEGDADLVRQVRIGRHPNNTTRVVLDAAGVSSYSVYPLYEPYRIVIDCVRETRASATTGAVDRVERVGRVETVEPAPPPVRPAVPPAPIVREPTLLSARPSTPVWLRSAPANTSQHGVALAEAHAPQPQEVSETVPLVASTAPRKPADVLAAAPPPAVRNGNGNFSIARQLGLNVSRIVIDPGHGGHDPGAQARGVVESELVLDVALRLEKLLQKAAGVEVILTRRSDDYIALQERTAIANREGADLFLSIHANASTSPQAHGVETYFLNFASNLSAAAVAARENAASGQSMGALPDIVKAIALNNKLDESRDFAGAVQHAMLDNLRGSNRVLKDLGVKQAPFVVLIGASMPSVLAEISFVTNPQEAKLLKGNAYRQRIAEALFNAIRKYQGSLNKNLSVASQQ